MDNSNKDLSNAKRKNNVQNSNRRNIGPNASNARYDNCLHLSNVYLSKDNIFITSKTPFGGDKRASERLSPARAELRGCASN